MEELFSHVARKIGFDFELKPCQIECLHAVSEKKDLLAILPTGYGKSAIFQLASYVIKEKYNLDKSVCLILTPLNSIMMDQINSLAKKGINACFIDYQCLSAKTVHTVTNDDEYVEEDDEKHETVVSVPLDVVAEGKYPLVYAHPEALLSTKQGETLIQAFERNGALVCIAVDEAHMILEWYFSFQMSTS